ncbi:MAG: hypothetical protein ACRETO_02480 [Gammaproteobacteria bacterium]
MFKQLLILGLMTLGLAACASSPTERFAGSVKAAKQAGRPLTIYEWKYGPSWIYNDTAIEPGIYAGLGFINTADQPIKKVEFTIAAYRGKHPVLNAQGEPLVYTLAAVGPFNPDSSQLAVTSKPLWALADSNNRSRVYRAFDGGSDSFMPNCFHVSGIRIEYESGTSTSVTAEQASTYFTPQVNKDCAPHEMINFAARNQPLSVYQNPPRMPFQVKPDSQKPPRMQ